MADLAVSVLDGLTRGTPLVINAPPVTTPCEATVSETLTARATTVSGVLYDASGTPVAQGMHPRTIITAPQVTALRAQIVADSAFRARWQAAITAFEAVGGYWANRATAPKPLNYAFWAFLTCVRPDEAWTAGVADSLGLIWGTSRATAVAEIAAYTLTYGAGTSSGQNACLPAATYDLLYSDLDTAQRATIHANILTMIGPSTALKWASAGGQWDDQTSDEHVAKVWLSLAAEDAGSNPERAARALSETTEYANAHAWMQYGEGMGYCWKSQCVTNTSPPFSMFLLKNALALSNAETLDLCVPSLRFVWEHLYTWLIPNGNAAQNPRSWYTARFNYTQPRGNYHGQPVVGSAIFWSYLILPGQVQTTDSDGVYANQASLVNSEADLLAYGRRILTLVPPGTPADRVMEYVLTNYKWIGQTGSAANEKGNMWPFYAFPPWLISNIQLPTAKTADEAGMPTVRRWWPGTLNWVSIVGGTRESSTDQSLVMYNHRRWFTNAYTEGCTFNGSWQAHRGGPLLMKRGATSHTGWGGKTFTSNGCVFFYDTTTTEFTLTGEDTDRGCARDGISEDNWSDILTHTESDFGRITSWYADSQIVAITSDLTRSYSSTVTTYGGGLAKTSGFTREFVVVQRGADGTDRERIFTYDRIACLGSGRWLPTYVLNPATNPTLNGVETAYTPWYPDPAGASINEPVGATWKATGPIRWDYTGATTMEYSNHDLVSPAVVGSGRVKVTWVAPASAAVRKRGGLAQYWDPQIGTLLYNNVPAYWPNGGLAGYDGQWWTENTVANHPYTGLYTVYVQPASFAADTRFLIGADVCAWDATADTAVALATDTNHAGIRLGASAAVFAKTPPQASGSATIPSGVVLLVLANLTPGQSVTLSASGGLSLTTAGRTASAGIAEREFQTSTTTANTMGRLVVGLSGSGTLTWS